MGFRTVMWRLGRELYFTAVMGAGPVLLLLWMAERENLTDAILGLVPHVSVIYYYGILSVPFLVTAFGGYLLQRQCPNVARRLQWMSGAFQPSAEAFVGAYRVITGLLLCIAGLALMAGEAQGEWIVALAVGLFLYFTVTVIDGILDASKGALNRSVENQGDHSRRDSQLMKGNVG